jgi:hypothetical protein
MSIESIQSALNLLRDNCPTVRVSDDFEALFISDTHFGVRDDADDFNRAGHEDLLLDVVNRSPVVCLGGDFADLLENPKEKDIWRAYPKVHKWRLDNHAVYEIEGNHNPIKGLPAALRFLYPDGNYILWTHGHKGDWACDAGSWLGKFFVRYVWAGIGQRIFHMADPTTARKEGNPDKHLEVRQAVNQWVKRQNEKMIGTIWGHSHYQEQVGRSFNDGSWIAEVAQGAAVKERKITLRTFT